MNNFQQRGDVIRIAAAAAAVASGQVVRIGNLLAVANHAAAIGAPLECNLTGVYVVPKVAGAVIAQGETLLWDASAAAFDDNLAVAAAGDVGGAAAVAFEAAGAGVASLAVLFTGVPGTLT